MSTRTLFAAALALWVGLVLIVAASTAAVVVVHDVRAVDPPSTVVRPTVCAANDWSCAFNNK